jgi:uncharacterized protein
MRKVKISTLFMVVLLLAALLWTSAVLAVTPKVYDKANLFSKEEIDALESSAAALSEKLQLDIVIVTTEDNEGKTSQAYADDFYDQNGFGFGTEADGVLLLINMQDREVYISTCGIAIQYLTDARINSILDTIYTDLGEGKYGAAATAFLQELEYYVEQGIPSNQYTQDENGNVTYSNASPERPMTPQEKIAISLAIALAVGGISIGVMAAMNRGRSTINQNTYLENRALDIISRRDDHINTQITHVTIQTNTGGGGSRSSTHHSSSGRSHGGGGRKF